MVMGDTVPIRIGRVAYNLQHNHIETFHIAFSLDVASWLESEPEMFSKFSQYLQKFLKSCLIC